MMRAPTLFISILFLLCGCDDVPYLERKESFTYQECIREAFAGSHSFTADETRALCKEITERVMSYEYRDGNLVPGDEYTARMEPKMDELRKRDLSEDDMETERLLAKYECLEAK